MGRPINDLTGKVIGSLEVLYRAENGVRGLGDVEYRRWVCRCECGTIREYDAGYLIQREKLWLKSGGKVSCGCKRRLLDGESACKEAFYYCKRNAKLRNYSFNISLEEFKILSQKNCNYCGMPPSNKIDNGYNTGLFIYNGIDRVDNSIGYELYNLTPCCKTCNIAKRTMTREEFLEWIEKVYNHSIVNTEMVQ